MQRLHQRCDWRRVVLLLLFRLRRCFVVGVGVFNDFAHQDAVCADFGLVWGDPILVLVAGAHFHDLRVVHIDAVLDDDAERLALELKVRRVLHRDAQRRGGIDALSIGKARAFGQLEAFVGDAQAVVPARAVVAHGPFARVRVLAVAAAAQPLVVAAIPAQHFEGKAVPPNGAAVFFAPARERFAPIADLVVFAINI